ncbi:MAG: hypothetical protein AB7V13_03700 [Pseudorhodoplanes sp.]|uniref:hypothetical protein n=1 Tax=Pseudorhodoplanes sp. TaxID=1934341 RepID=UPI003D144101
MTARQLAQTALVAAFWIAFMIWWTADYRTTHIVMLTVTGIVVAAIWAWSMKRFGRWS